MTTDSITSALRRINADWPREALAIRWLAEVEAGKVKERSAIVGCSDVTNPESAVYWDITGMGHSFVGSFKDLTIVKSYGWFDTEVDVTLAEVWDQYDRDNPPVPFDLSDPSLPLAAYGMVAPDGSLYRCEYGEHSDLARHLALVMDLPDTGSRNKENDLRELGWATLRYADYQTDSDTYTDGQLATWAALIYNNSRNPEGYRGMAEKLTSAYWMWQTGEMFDREEPNV